LIKEDALPRAYRAVKEQEKQVPVAAELLAKMREDQAQLLRANSVKLALLLLATVV